MYFFQTKFYLISTNYCGFRVSNGFTNLVFFKRFNTSEIHYLFCCNEYVITTIQELKCKLPQSIQFQLKIMNTNDKEYI